MWRCYGQVCGLTKCWCRPCPRSVILKYVPAIKVGGSFDCVLPVRALAGRTTQALALLRVVHKMLYERTF